MIRRLCALLLSLLAFPPLVVADPGGADAPNRWQDALDVAPGTYAGTSGSPGVDHDWYRVAHPAGKGIRATLTTTGSGAGLSGRTDDGRSTGSISASTVTARILYVADPVANAVRIDVYGSGAAYNVTFEVVDVVNAAVTSLVVTETQDCRFAPDVGQGCEQQPPVVRMRVQLSNLGAYDFRGHLTLSAVSATGSWTIGTMDVELPVGDSVTLTWHSHRSTPGTVVIMAHVIARSAAGTIPDAYSPDDRRSANHTYLMPGPAVGF